MEILVHSRIFVSIKVSKELAPFQQAQVRIPNFGVQCKKLFNRPSGIG